MTTSDPLSETGETIIPAHVTHEVRADGYMLMSKKRMFLIILIAFVVFALALWAIRYHLKDLTIDEIFISLRAYSPVIIALAIAATMMSYLGAAFFDVLALRYTSANLKVRRTFFASFSAYAISNTVGMPLLTGNIIRYRLYSNWGLGMGAIAIIAIVSTLTLIAGGLSVAGVGLLSGLPQFSQILNLSMPLVIALSIAVWGILFLMVKLAVTGPEIKHVRGVELRRPKFSFACLQIGAGIMDWAFAACVLYVLLPDALALHFGVFAAFYVFATLLGGLSGVPGGLGVFEATLLILLPNGNEAEIAASLIAYRAIYFILPLIISGVLFLVHQVFQAKSTIVQNTARIGGVTTSLVPFIFAVLTFVSGIVMLASAATPSLIERLKTMEMLIPEGLIELSHFAASIIGFLLLLIALGIRRRLRRAWVLGCLLLALGIIFTVFKGGTQKEIIILSILMVLLVASKDAFYRKANLRQIELGIPSIALIIGTLTAVSWLGFFSYQHIQYTDDLWWEFALNGDISRFLRASAGISVLALIVGVAKFMRPKPQFKKAQTSLEEITKAREVLAQAEGVYPDAYLALLGDKHLMFSESGRSFIMYGIKGRNWFALGEPVGLKSERKALLKAFRDQADIMDAWPAFYGVREKSISEFLELGLIIQKVGEAAMVPIKDCELKGQRWAKFRQARNRALREDCEFEVIERDAVAQLLPRLKTISDQWLVNHAGMEKSFSLGRFDPQFIQEGPIAVAKHNGEIVAFSTLWTGSDRYSLSMDLMRYVPDSLQGIMDYLFAELVLWAGSQGYEVFDVGMVPLSGLTGGRSAPLMNRIGAFVYQYGGKLYGFGGLRQFKNKFKPEWEARYLAAPNNFQLSIALGNLALLSGGGVRGIVKRKGQK